MFWHILEFCAIYVQNFASKNTSAELNRCFEGLVQLAKVLSLFQQFKMDPSGFDPTEHQHRRWNPMTAQWILGNQFTMFFHVINQDLCLSVLINERNWPMALLHIIFVPSSALIGLPLIHLNQCNNRKTSGARIRTHEGRSFFSSVTSSDEAALERSGGGHQRGGEAGLRSD